ncbi:MAG TPA: PD-(D/E)XK nuclease family protein [Methylophilaceae bacterium]|nr:PD-(D/E)XK nuclease family protein [Methylophilaceae bacterium]
MEPSPDLILCSTARLARSIRLAHAADQRRTGMRQWLPLQALTLSQWLAGLTQRVLLSGKVSPGDIPHMALDGMAERLLWEQVITDATAANPQQQLFDVAGMAQTAMEANALMQGWGVRFPDQLLTDETRQFLRWRAAFRTLCRRHNVLEETRMLELQIELVKHAELPETICLAGFDRISPQEQRLFDALTMRGATLRPWVAGLESPGHAVKKAFDEAEAECCAAAAWVCQRLTDDPSSRLAIVVPELANLRPTLQSMLDDALHPESMHPAQAEIPRAYDFSLGQPLAEQPLVATAVALLRLAFGRQATQQECSTLLRDVYWSAGRGEADARARLDATMRRKLPATISFDQLLRHARKAQEKGLGIGRLVQHLEGLQQKNVSTRQRASAWARTFAQALEAAHWPGERGLSSHEFQARQAWKETLQVFSGLDPLLDKLSAGDALRQLSRLLRERIFQPESAHVPQIQVMGMLEATGQPLDALWVMGMNDHTWPPPARPNPLLPAEVQRSAGTPNSCSRVQAEFALAIHQRLLRTAPELVFSWAHRDGERELRVSPLLKDIPLAEQGFELAKTLAEQLAVPAEMQWLQDHQAPRVEEDEKVRGGAGLFQAQAVCPAWGYYQYRLGARALEEPVDGLDSMARGSLLHAVLQAFWSGRDSEYLNNMDQAAQQAAVQQAVEAGVKQFSQDLDESLPTHFLALEKLRLAALLDGWLALERERLPFTVQDCERNVKLDIKGISVEFKLDRVDVLPDGRMVVIDYKTSAQLSPNSWAEDRISEPQLPIYAALVLIEGEVAAVCFAKVRAGEHQFVGIASDAGTLPGVKGLEEARKVFDAEKFPEWHALLQHWRDSLEAIADEIRAGEAAVRFEDEEQLAWCEVKPLLRLPERKLQLEREGKR